jgi:hypothetical protein
MTEDEPRNLGPHNIVYINPLSDQEKADKYRAEVADLLEKITDCMGRAKKDGLTVNFQLGPADAFGRFGIAMLEISKKLA